ncbi:hypothetical protein VCSRO207_2716 [Vibrio cholerae]|nr:hypothetical protein VCSRO207_2716 [Vibrio cholerae]
MSLLESRRQIDDFSRGFVLKLTRYFGVIASFC